MNKTQAKRITGGLSVTTAMPCPSYSLPAIDSCPTGAKLALVPGSICSGCYANGRGNYHFRGVKVALETRQAATHGPEWVAAMVAQIEGLPFFRWHDSGDLYSEDYFLRVLEVVRKTPATKHWLPTREKALVSHVLETTRKPRNLVIRLSAAMVDGPPPKAPHGVQTSTVHHKAKPQGFECRKPYQQNQCGDCRACWNGRIKNISYLKHGAKAPNHT